MMARIAMKSRPTPGGEGSPRNSNRAHPVVAHAYSNLRALAHAGGACQYGYCSRLTSKSVLIQSIKSGLTSRDTFFAMADGYDGSRYANLTLGGDRSEMRDTDLLVKVSVAQK